MERRKFLNIGGLGLLAINGFSRNVLPYFVSGSGQLCDHFMQLAGARSTTEGVEILSADLVDTATRPFEKIGYKRKEKFFWQTGKFYLLPLELISEFAVIDEVLLVFHKKNIWKYTGSLSASLMNWMMQNYMNEDVLYSQKPSDIFLPIDINRRVEKDFVVFQTKKGAFGYQQYVHAKEVSMQAFVSFQDKLVCQNAIKQISIYPELQFHNTLSHI